MNADKILKMINKEQTEYFAKRKNCSTFLQHFSFKSFFNRYGLSSILFSPMLIVPINFFLIKSLFLTYLWIPLLSIPLSMILYIFILPLLHKYYSKMKFLYTKHDTEKQDAYLRKVLIDDFDEQKINNYLLNHLKIELSEEQYVEIMSANKDPTYKNVKNFIEKEVSIQNIKDSQRNVILTSDEIKEYSKNHDYVKLNII